LLHIPQITREGDFVHITFNSLELTSRLNKSSQRAAQDSATPHVICDGIRYTLKELNGIWSTEVPERITAIVYQEHIYEGEL